MAIIPGLRFVYWDLAAAYFSISDALAPQLTADDTPSYAARPWS